MEILDSFSLKNGAQNPPVVYSLSVQHLSNHFLSHYVQILLILHQYSYMHHKRFVLLLKRNSNLITFLYCHKFMPCNRSFPFLYTFKAITNLSRFFLSHSTFVIIQFLKCHLHEKIVLKSLYLLFHYSLHYAISYLI